MKADSLSVPHRLCGLCVLQRLHDRVVGDLGVVVIVEEEGLLPVNLFPVGVPEDGLKCAQFKTRKRLFLPVRVTPGLEGDAAIRAEVDAHLSKVLCL